jgi:DNA polymerase III delta prime subunit
METSDLQRLVQTLKQDLSMNASYLSSIPYPKTLIESIEDISNLIGNERVKESIFTQLSYVLAMKKKNQEHQEQAMLNVLFYGPPGTGKTLIATKIAKVWWSLGYLQTSMKKDGKNSGGLLTSAQSMVKSYSSEEKFMDDILIFGQLFVVFGTLFWSMASYVYKEYGLKVTLWWMLILGILILILILALEEGMEWEREGETVNLVPKDTSKSSSTLQQEPPKDLVQVVSRSDFVDRYSGWTDKKTLHLLQKNIGKVLFVDEAYSLCSGPRDTFGIEALNALNLFMSQHPGEIIVIFAGYKDLIDQRIFEIQPGLRRRFMWHFDCEGYTPNELFEIYQKQLQHRHLTLYEGHQARIRQLFHKYKTLFSNYGGDTERLAFFSDLEHAKALASTSSSPSLLPFNFASENVVSETKLGISQFKQALKKLKDNRISEHPPSEDKDVSKWMRSLQNMMS